MSLKVNPQKLAADRAFAESKHLRDIHKLIMDGCEADQVFYRLRENIHDGVTRAAVDAIAADYAEKWASPPLVRAALVLFHEEVWLRNDIADALYALDPAAMTPQDIRDAMSEARSVEENKGLPAATLRRAVDLLREAGADVAALDERVDKLYPPKELPDVE